MTDDVTRRRFLTALGSGAAMALAGCGQPNDPSVDKDPNSYDYQYVESRELAVNLPAYRDEPVTTQTTVRFDSDYLSMDNGDESLRLYTATPDDTVHTFPVGEHLDGPIYNALGDDIHTEDYDEIVLQLYGHPQEVSDWEDDGYEGGMTIHEDIFIVDDAQIIDDNTETTTGTTNTTVEGS